MAYGARIVNHEVERSGPASAYRRGRNSRQRADRLEHSPQGKQFLEIPPFPGSRVAAFNRVSGEAVDPGNVLAALVRERVGGAFWASRPPLPGGAVVVRPTEAVGLARMAFPNRPIVHWPEQDHGCSDADVLVAPLADAWHILDGATAFIAAPRDLACLIAALQGVAVYRADEDGGLRQDVRSPEDLLEAVLPAGAGYASPFTGEPLSALEAIELCGFWRRLIDSNRGIAGGYGFAFWKKENVEPLLWGGEAPFRFLAAAGEIPSNRPVALWRSRTPQPVIKALEAAGTPLIEVEDGFLRSRGLGADCVPPLSIVVDRRGPYFDPSQASELELLLQDGKFGPDLLARAASLRRTIVQAGLGKYESGGAPMERFDASRRQILVPGQVEDDRSILTGGAGLETNADLLARVRAQAPDAYVIYKPHPDVLAGHRKGAVPKTEALRFADRIVTDQSISALLDMVDEAHVNTSLTGFEALLRGKPVTTYGVPFYAGWGLTTDLGPVPARRTARRTIDELVAATLLLYPRYLDPISGLPCPAEVAVQRLAQAPVDGGNWLVVIRRLQGKLMRRFRSLR